MGFIPISIDNYVIKHLENNPADNEGELRAQLNRALADYKNGKKCLCGNDIWVIGSAAVGNSCYTCITGESYPIDDFEIDLAIKKSENNRGQHIDTMDPTKICGFFDDDGYQINTELIKKPPLCLLCIHNDVSEEEFLCSMTRYDQRNDEEFQCFAFLKK